MQGRRYFLSMIFASVVSLKGMEKSSTTIVTSGCPIKNYGDTVDNHLWFACHAYNNGKFDVAVQNFRRDPSTELFKKIDGIQDMQERKRTLQSYCHYLFASRQYETLKQASKDDKPYTEFLRQSIVNACNIILETNPDNDVAKEIAHITKKIYLWLASYSYNLDCPEQAIMCFKELVKNQKPSELLELINGIPDESKKQNALGCYWHYQCGIALCEEAKSGKTITEEAQQAIAKAFRQVLNTRYDTSQVGIILRDTLKAIDSFTAENLCLYTGWEKVGYHFKAKKITRAIKELDACVLWTERQGFSYSWSEMDYIFNSPTYDAIIHYNYQTISDIIQQALFLQKTSQLMVANLSYKNQLSSKSLEDPCKRITDAATMLTVLLLADVKLEASLNSTQLSMRWWQSKLDGLGGFYQLQESLSKVTRQQRIKKIITYLDKFPNMDIESVTNFVEQVLEKYQDITNHDLGKTAIVRRIFAFKEFIDQKSDVTQRLKAVETLKILAEKDIYAANMLGIICTYPKYMAKISGEDVKKYKELGIAYLSKAFLHANTMEPKAKTVIEYQKERISSYILDSVLKYYLSLQGNCYIHAELATMHARFNSLDKMREHAEDMFNTCYLAEHSSKFLSTKLDDILNILVNNRVSVSKLKSFINSITGVALSYGIHIQSLPAYRALMESVVESNHITNQN